MGLPPEIEIRLQPKQTRFDKLIEESPASWIGFGGSRGGAKSGGARRTMLRRRFEYPGTTGQIIRRVWEDVRLNHVEKFFQEFPSLLPYYRVAEHEVTIPTSGAPSKIKFDSAETETDVKRKAAGPEFMDIFVDQAEQFTEKELKLLKTTCRWPNTSAHRCKFGLFFNPGGVGAAFLRRVFYAHEYQENERREDFEFLQSYGWDNSQFCLDALRVDGLTEEDFYGWTDKQRFEYFITRSQYGRELNSLPKAMRLGHLLGTFDSFAGQYFDIFDAAKHVHDVRSFGLQPWMSRWLAIDWGFAHPTVVEWACQDGKVTKQYREYKVQGLGPRAIAHEIVDRSRGEKIETVYLSPDAFAHRTSESSIAEQIGEVLRANGLPSPIEADNDRVGGWALMYDLLRSGEWQIGDNCQALIESLPMLTRDEKKPEDGLKFEGDDALDATRYLLYSRQRAKRAPGTDPVSEKVAERIAAAEFTDRTSEMIWKSKYEVQERKKTSPIHFGRRINRRNQVVY